MSGIPTTFGAIVTLPLDQHCSWCGATPDRWRTLVTGPGVTICSDCLLLVAVIMTTENAAPNEAAPDEPDRANCSTTCPYCCEILAKVNAALSDSSPRAWRVLYPPAGGDVKHPHP